MQRIALLVLTLLATFALASCGDDSPPAATDSGVVDTGAAIDTGVSEDAGFVPCDTDEECEDGFYCNGVEACEGGRCVDGPPVRCDDGIECTNDICSEERATCLNLAPDEDGDGRRDRACLDAAGEPLGDDCDDTDANRFPGNLEVCDIGAHDEDCDDETYGAIDLDEDGFDDAQCCNMGEGGVPNCGEDCDDLRANVNARASEVCDGIDNDCDDEVDEMVSVELFRDSDGDGHGDPDTREQRCAGAAGFSELGDDCDDEDPARHPAQLEICDEVDNDCDDLIDEEENDVPWYADLDTDGYGSAASGVTISCEPVAGHSLLDTDCDDTVAAINPAAAELCDGLDNDCSGSADFQIGVNDFEDDDNDGIVDLACGPPLGEDCDDRNPLTGPGTVERCDGRDNDCDGEVDEGATDAVWFVDGDGDGFGSPTSGAIVSCLPIAGYARLGGDCDDTNPERFPGAIEVCNGEDDDCDGAVDDAPATANSCSLPNAVSLCISGLCTVAACSPGFGDCDMNPATGCEQNLMVVEHCGECGNRCDAPNTASRCDGGTCAVVSCAAGWADCNTFGEDGCETSLSTNSNCGGCGTPCTVADGFGECGGGECIIRDCNPGFGDCDRMTDNGCEESLDTLENCGHCGESCDFRNGSGRCDPFMGCVLESCDAGFEDCNRNPNDGCEARISSDVMNCGGCGFGCNAPNTNFTCAMGRCEIASCVGDNDDCDRDPFNGCESDTQRDLHACGGCGRPCDIFNGFARCETGNCEIDGCMPGWDDCDTSPDNGCESDIWNDPDRCGGCGASPCSDTIMNAAATCNMGTCGIGFCDGGFDNCDASEGNGCETPVESDPDNCGACGVSCGTGGTCEFNTCDRVMEVVVGGDFSCALRHSGRVVCWGGNASGQLGDGSTAPSNTPVVVAGVTDAYSIAAGAQHVCAATFSGPRCWGENGDGQLGDGTMTDRSTAVPVAGPDFGRFAAGANHTCALTAAGEVYCWGSDGAGQIGDGGVIPGPGTPNPSWVFDLTEPHLEIAAGDGFTCAQSQGGVLTCWGAGVMGQLGNGVMANAASPTTFWAGHENVLNMGVGRNHGCLVRQVVGDLAECWGANARNQLGDGTMAPSSVPVGVVALPSPRSVMVGGEHTCAMTGINSVMCWGDNTYGQTGSGTVGGSMLMPTSVMNGVLMLARSASNADHTCLITEDERVMCFGRNTDGQIGNGTTGGNVPTPTEVVGLR